MGLSMYLYKELYISDFQGKTSLLEPIKNLIGAKDETGNFKHVIVYVPAIYWRGIHSIHKWFVDNVQNGCDNCATYHVETDQLKELLEMVRERLKDKPDKMSHAQMSEMERTRRELEREIRVAEEEGCSFTYRASW